VLPQSLIRRRSAAAAFIRAAVAAAFIQAAVAEEEAAGV
jgi:hypothetical protein